MTTLVLELLPMILLTHAFREAGEIHRFRESRDPAARPKGRPQLVTLGEAGRADTLAA